MRDKLIELLIEGHKKHLFYDQIADYLIANGVTIESSENIDFDYAAED